MKPPLLRSCAGCAGAGVVCVLVAALFASIASGSPEMDVLRDLFPSTTRPHFLQVAFQQQLLIDRLAGSHAAEKQRVLNRLQPLADADALCAHASRQQRPFHGIQVCVCVCLFERMLIYLNATPLDSSS